MFFKREEFVCKCGCGRGAEEVQQVLLDLLERARGLAGVPFVVTSGYRCPEYNKLVGGVGESAHTKGLGVDVATAGSGQRFLILMALLTVGFARVGVGKGFIHADLDNSKPQEVMWLYD